MRRLLGAAVLMLGAFLGTWLLPGPGETAGSEAGVKVVNVAVGDGSPIVVPAASAPPSAGAVGDDPAAALPPPAERARAVARALGAPERELAGTSQDDLDMALPPESGGLSEGDMDAAEAAPRPAPVPPEPRATANAAPVPPPPRPEPPKPAPTAAPKPPPQVAPGKPVAPPSKPVVKSAAPKAAPTSAAAPPNPKPPVGTVAKSEPAKPPVKTPAKPEVKPPAKPPAAKAPAAPSKPAVTVASAAPSGASGRWYIQAGSYSDIANARLVEGKLRAAGLSAIVAPVETQNGVVYRVRGGPFAGRDKASAALTRAQAGGVGGNLVQDGG